MVGPGHLYDLDEMVLRCHGPSARDYIEEAVMAYKIGAYRSSITATWIAVYFDLVDKLRIHARAGVAPASSWIEQFESYIRDFEPGNPKSTRSMLNMESEILNKAAEPDIGILTGLECEDLKRLREDRHRCAHPTFINDVDKFSPTAERARNHIRIAIDSVLSKNAVPGSLMAARILSNCRSKYFPVESAAAELELRTAFENDLSDGVLGSVSESLIEDIFDGGISPTERHQRTAAVDAIHEISGAAASTALGNRIREMAVVSDPYRWWIAIALLNQFQWAWDSFEGAQHSLFERVVRHVDIDSESGVGAVVEATTTEPLAAVGAVRARDLRIEALAANMDSLPTDVVKQELLRRLEGSKNWRTSERLFALLMKRSGFFDDDKYATALVEHATSNDQVLTAPKLIELLTHFFIHRVAEHYSDELRQAIGQLLEAMSSDYRVSTKELQSLIAMSNFLVGTSVQIEEES